MRIILTCLLLLYSIAAFNQNSPFTLLKPARVFDGENMHHDWVVLVQNDSIVQAGPMRFKLPADTRIIELNNCTLLPGLIEGHSHLYLHPYNETRWDDQVLKESRAERNARAVNHAKAALLAGFTTVRDLGTEGAMYDDAGLKKAIEKGIIPGPRLIVSTRAIVAKGTYGPRSESPDIDLPQGAEEVAGLDDIRNAVRSQIGHGADFIKVYADFRYGLSKEERPTFSQEELNLLVQTTQASGRKVVAHASAPEGMKCATLAGVVSIEHGDEGDEETFKLMKQKGVALCPTLAASEAVEQYNGWKKGVDPEPARIVNKHKSFALALKSGVTICMGGDVGVFTHGDNAREMDLMVEYGMKPLDVLRSTTSINADVFGYSHQVGRIRKGLLADIVVVNDDPSQDIKNIRKTKMVMKGGTVFFLAEN